MHLRYIFRLTLIAMATLVFAQVAPAQTAGEARIANFTANVGSVHWDIYAPNAGGAVTLTFPDGRQFKKAFKGGSSFDVELNEKQADGLPDGVYNWELRLNPVLTAAQKDALMKARGNDDDSEDDRAGRKRPVMPSMTASGTFAVSGGMIVGPGGIEGQRIGSNNLPQPKAPAAAPARVSENTIARLRNHRFSLMKPDVVNADDFIVQGSLCVGLDCVNNESFGFDTIRLKENNTRIKFDDTSTAAGFPNVDWQLTANDSNSGGANKFSIEDITNSKVPFTVTAGAPTNSLFVASSGRVGLGNSSPGLNIHITGTDTPAIRQEQTSGGGFTAQTWDIGANEANWFVRDLTGGSRLPFRIRPGAPTSSIDIAANGNVGIGTASPSTTLHINSATQAVVAIDGSANGSPFISFRQNNTELSYIQLTDNGASTDYLAIATQGSRNVALAPTGGNVGIGTNAPDQKLSVSGDADKSAGGTSWGVFSDERLKNIKGSYSRGLSAVMGLRPVRFSYKSDNPLALPSDTENIGFSAQALQRVVPEAVTRNANGYLVMHSDPILWAMVNAIQEQQKEIASLKAQVQKLRRTSRRHSK